MSMREYPICDDGLLLKKEDFEPIAKYLREYCEDEDADTVSLVIEVFDNYGIGNYGEGSGYFSALDVNSPEEGVAYENDDVFIIPFQKAKTYFEAAYENIEEMIEEVKNYKLCDKPLCEILPGDFPWKQRLGTFYSTYFG